MLARLLPIALIVTALATVSAAARTHPFKFPRRSGPSSGLPGQILVKLDRATFLRGLSPATFGEEGGRYGIYNVERWIEPKLLLHGRPLYKIGGGTDGIEEIARIIKVDYSALDAPEDVALAISRIPGVEYAEPVYPRDLLFSPNDPDAHKQWHLDAINARRAWDFARADSTIIIAVTDTGIEKGHEDLSGTIWHNPGESGDKSNNGQDDDGNGYIDDWWGYDMAVSNGSDPDNDPRGVEQDHGTVVAGLAAAQGNNGIGIVGVGFGARIMSVKVTDDRLRTKVYNGAKGVLYAAKMGAQIINCSWGGMAYSRAEEEVFRHVIRDMRRIVVAAAGNDVEDELFYPAAYDGVISVASVTAGNSKVPSSNCNYDVDISAPGVDLYSTTFGGYTYDYGTSFAAPIVSGLAALLLKRYPELRASGEIDVEKVRELILAGADDIRASLGPAYADKMGAGKVNAERSMGAMEMASARMIDYTLVESVPDGAIDAGETVRIRADIKNILAGSSQVTASLACISYPSITINGASTNLGPMVSEEVKTTADGVFEIAVPASIDPNTVLTFRLSVETEDRVNREYITFLAAPTYQTTDLNRIVATFNSVGNIAFNGMNRDEGDGFSFDGSNNLIFHGGLMIGLDASRLPNVVRVGGNSEGTDDGFRTTKRYRIAMASDSSVEIGTAEFNDAHMPAENRAGVDVSMRTYEYRDPASSNIVLVSYRITNRSGAPMSGLRCGLYLDWDVSTTGYSDQTIYDGGRRLGLTRAVGPTHPTIYTGATLLSAQEISFYAVDNDAQDVTLTFPRSKKWEMLTSGIHENITITDAAMVIGAGPIALAPGESVEVAFALMGAGNLDSLHAAIDRARALYSALSGVRTPASPGPVARIDALPNPFAEATSLSVTMPSAGEASLAIYDLRGVPVATIFEGRLEAGTTEIPVNAAELPDGVYIYELRTPDGIAREKVVKQSR